MNSHDQIPTPEPKTSDPLTPFLHRGNGKVARLPKPLRDQVNHGLADGLSYPNIIERLGEHGKDLRPDNLSEWKKRGHQVWLLEQTWLAEIRARQEPAVSLSTDFDATQLNHAALQLGALHIFEALRDLNSPRFAIPPGQPAHLANSPNLASAALIEQTKSPGGAASSPVSDHAPSPRRHPEKSQLDSRLGGDCSGFVRLINALARSSRETMVVQKYRDAYARARAELQKIRDPKRKLSESERRAIVRHVDDILGLSTPDESDGSGRGDESSPRSSQTLSETSSQTSSQTSSEILSNGSNAQSDEPFTPPLGTARIPADNAPPHSRFTHHESIVCTQQSINPLIQESISPSAQTSGTSVQSSPSSSQTLAQSLSNGFNPQSDECITPPGTAGIPAGDGPPLSLITHPESNVCTHQSTNPLIQQSTHPLPAEHCLQCGSPLPPLLPDGSRPSPWCACGSPIAAPPGFSIRELCPYCSAPIPVHGYNISRWSGTCSECKQKLPALDPKAPLKWLLPTSEFQERARNLH